MFHLLFLSLFSTSTVSCVFPPTCPPDAFFTVLMPQAQRQGNRSSAAKRSGGANSGSDSVQRKSGTKKAPSAAALRKSAAQKKADKEARDARKSCASLYVAILTNFG